MLERPARGIFPELHVFPGGKVDDEDQVLAETAGEIYAKTQWGLGPETKFAVTAIRECFEEAGVLFVKSATADTARDFASSEYRESLLASKHSFNQILEEESLEPDFSRLLYFSHWITPARAPARFNTRFFVARLPSEQTASHHITETASGTWVSPSQALRNYATGDWQMIWPTLTTLRMISGYRNLNRLMSDVERGRHRIPITAAMHAQGMQYFELS